MKHEPMMDTSMTGAHCKACDASFKPSWREDHGIWEDLCSKCVGISMAAVHSFDVGVAAGGMAEARELVDYDESNVDYYEGGQLNDY